MPEETGEYKYVADVGELEPHGQLAKWVDGHEVLIYRWQGGVRALSNVCRHFGGPVGFHKMREGRFTCLWHNYQYSGEDGSCLTNPALPLRRYRVKIDGGGIWVAVLGGGA